MPRHPFARDGRRHLCPMPSEVRAQQPFVVDLRSGRIIAPWPRKQPLPGDEARMDALLEQLDPEAFPAAVCWCWPDRDPVPIRGTPPGWLRSWARDRASDTLAACGRPGHGVVILPRA
jgi:hypothetical protein